MIFLIFPRVDNFWSVSRRLIHIHLQMQITEKNLWLTVNELNVIPNGDAKSGGVDFIPMSHREVGQRFGYFKLVVKQGTEFAKSDEKWWDEF